MIENKLLQLNDKCEVVDTFSRVATTRGRRASRNFVCTDPLQFHNWSKE